MCENIYSTKRSHTNWLTYKAEILGTAESLNTQSKERFTRHKNHQPNMHLTNYTTAEAAGELKQMRAVILKIMTFNTQQQDYEGR